MTKLITSLAAITAASCVCAEPVSALAPMALGVPPGYQAIYAVDWRTEGFGGPWGFANERYRDKSKIGMNGFGFDMFLDPTAREVPVDYLTANPLGPFELMPGRGLAIRSQPPSASLRRLITSQGFTGGKNFLGQLIPSSWVSAYSTTRGKLEAKPPTMIVFYIAEDDPAAGSWVAGWGLGGKDGASPKVETDVHESFQENPPQMNSTMHVDASGYHGGFRSGSLGMAPKAPLVGVVHQYAVIIAADGARTFLLDGRPMGTITAKAMGGGVHLTDTFVPIIDQAGGFPWRSGYAPKRPLQSIVQGVGIFAPSTVGSILPNTPAPLPSFAWARSYASGVIPRRTPVGTIVGSLSGAAAYGIVDKSGNLKVAGSLLVVAKALAPGRFAFVPQGFAGDGTLGYGATFRAMVK